MFETIKAKATQTYNKTKKWVKDHPAETKVIAAGAVATGLVGWAVWMRRHPKNDEMVTVLLDGLAEAKETRAKLEDPMAVLDIPTITDAIAKGADYDEIESVAKNAVKNALVNNNLPNITVDYCDLMEAELTDQPLVDIIANGVNLSDLGDFGKALLDSGCFDPNYMVSMIVNETAAKF